MSEASARLSINVYVECPSRQALSSYSENPNSSDPASRQALEGEPSVWVHEKVFKLGLKRFEGRTDCPTGMWAVGMVPLYTYPVSTKVPEAWRTTMKELADDLESEIESRRSGDLDRRIERDLIVVKEARVLLDEQEQGQ